MMYPNRPLKAKGVGAQGGVVVSAPVNFLSIVNLAVDTICVWGSSDYCNGEAS
jgi:hypothetical protein